MTFPDDAGSYAQFTAPVLIIFLHFLGFLTFLTFLVLMAVAAQGRAYLEPFSLPLGLWEAGLARFDFDQIQLDEILDIGYWILRYWMRYWLVR